MEYNERNGCVEDPPEINIIDTMANNSKEMKYTGMYIGENHNPYPFIFLIVKNRKENHYVN